MTSDLDIAIERVKAAVEDARTGLASSAPVVHVSKLYDWLIELKSVRESSLVDGTPSEKIKKLVLMLMQEETNSEVQNCYCQTIVAMAQAEEILGKKVKR